MKYKVKILKFDQTTVEIDAQSAEEAEEKAEVMCWRGEIEFEPCFCGENIEYHAEEIEEHGGKNEN